ncbi:MAG: hypothetical protein OEV94_02370 [Deltaproteobacteria bacterium]|nr:hypothetical protein [Deltaproteobacteria bacterium]
MGKIKIGSVVVDVVAVLNATMTVIQAETLPETGPMTSAPTNTTSHVLQQALLGKIKGG